ncbi:MAG: hypothetical protein IT461_00880 [Planctomycetes bacterium]|jgi:phage terminase Nu1 subunit (DNA packaging protein)|nr:hypothetical protein [Planctomycetota bacterium]
MRFAFLVHFVTACLVITLLTATTFGEEQARSPLDRAFESAKKVNLMVVAVFVKADDADCEDYVTETLNDREVKAWLGKNAVLCVLNSDANKQDAADYFVSSFPTTVFANADKQVLGRIEGDCSASWFVEQATEIADGNTDLAKARKAFADSPDSVDARYSLARELADQAVFREALEHYLWLFDHVLEKNRAYVGVRLSFMLSGIVEIGKHYPKALEELKKRRDAAEVPILEGKGSFEQAMDFVALNRELHELDRTLTAYLKLKANPKASKQVVTYLGEASADLLREQKKYAEAREAIGDLEAQFRSALQLFDLLGTRKEEDEELRVMMEESRREMLRGKVAILVEIACGCQDFEVAGKLADAMFAKFKDGAGYAALITAALRADGHKFAKTLRDAGLRNCTESKDQDAITEAGKGIDEAKAK